MGSVQELSPYTDLGRFFDTMYGIANGYAYSATKNPETGAFNQYYFSWPKEREKLIAHCIAYTDTVEVYYSPALFKRPGAKKEDFLGTYFVWAEFDGNAPDTISGIPSPSLKVRSSTDRNQHWYWRLDHFETRIDVVEAISQKITYHAEGDLSVWNVNRVLRPPGTKHHESGLLVSEIYRDIKPTPNESFSGLPDIPTSLNQEVDTTNVPSPVLVMMKYPFNQDETDFFITPSMAKGDEKKGVKGRSSALTKFAHICIEKGMANVEALSLLLVLDNRWGKFKNRSDQKERLVGIINHVRSRHPVDPITEDLQKEHAFKVYTYDEFINSEIKMEWQVENLLQKKGSLIVTGAPNVGKSQLSLRFAEKAARGQDFLQWKIPKPMKILVISMEMQFEELNFLMKAMDIEQNEDLRANLLISAPGHSVKLNDKARQAELNRIIEEFQPDGAIFDSFGMAINDDMSSDKIILETFDYINGTLRDEYGLFTWFIHHNRKAQVGNRKPNKLDDMYGNQYIGANINTGIGLYGTPKGIEVSCLKLRMAKKFNTFLVRRTDKLDFEVLEGFVADDDIPIMGGFQDEI